METEADCLILDVRDEITGVVARVFVAVGCEKSILNYQESGL